jgi:small subunit ribosomal protein SAe
LNKKGVCLLNIRRMWDKLVLAARAIAAVENPADVCIISARQISQRACLKFARYTGKSKYFVSLSYFIFLRWSLV